MPQTKLQWKTQTGQIRLEATITHAAQPEHTSSVLWLARVSRIELMGLGVRTAIPLHPDGDFFFYEPDEGGPEPEAGQAGSSVWVASAKKITAGIFAVQGSCQVRAIVRSALFPAGTWRWFLDISPDLTYQSLTEEEEQSGQYILLLSKPKVEDLLTRGVMFTHASTEAPAILHWPAFNAGPPPGGLHRWRIFFGKADNDTNAALTIQYHAPSENPPGFTAADFDWYIDSAKKIQQVLQEPHCIIKRLRNDQINKAIAIDWSQPEAQIKQFYELVIEGLSKRIRQPGLIKQIGEANELGLSPATYVKVTRHFGTEYVDAQPYSGWDLWQLNREIVSDLLFDWLVPPDIPSTEEHGWGQTSKDASALWPLGVAPIGYTSGDYGRVDLAAQLQPGDETSWELIVHWGTPSVEGWAARSEWKPGIAGPFPFSPRQAWNRCVGRQLHTALNTVKDAHPASLVPVFEPVKVNPTTIEDQEALGQHWETVYTLEDHAANGSPGLPLSKLRFEAICLKNSGNGFETVSLPGLMTFAGEPLRRRVRIKPPIRTQKADQETDALPPAIAFEFQEAQSPPGPGPAPAPAGASGGKAGQDQQVRIGAIDLTFPALAPDESRPTSWLSVRFPRPLTLEPKSTSAYLLVDEPIRLESEIELAVSRLSAGSQDPSPNEALPELGGRRGTLLVPVPASGNGSHEPMTLLKGKLRLSAREHIQEHRNHVLDMRLQLIRDSETPHEQAERPVSFIVIQSQPFLIGKVIALTGAGDSSEVANWDNSSPSEAKWELRQLEKDFKLLLPPQGMGEELIKTYPHTRPDRLPVRFTPPALLRLSRSLKEQNFTLAPWNLWRLFGYAGQEQPGVFLREARFEWLYGLENTVIREDLVLAEIESRLGRPPLAPPIRGTRYLPNGDNKSRKLYFEFLNHLASRLAYLQPVLFGRESAATIDLNIGVKARFRPGRRSANPTTSPTDPDPPLQGGADYIFESENIWREVTSTGIPPHGHSSSARVINPAFSTLGGYGSAVSGFAQDKTFYMYDTRMGRTTFLSLSRIGRIGVFWNRARHVIEYERTVVDSEQFKDPGKNWRGLPVVRKVREFVEILEPERRFPDAGGGKEHHSGFVRGLLFPRQSRIIPVTSSWGYDLPDGWAVPLHQPGADPSVYPRPDIRVLLASPRGEDDFDAVPITDPHKLVFYTSTIPTDTSNSDTWAPVPLIDFALEGIPSEQTKNLNPFVPDASIPDLSPGYQRFTFSLDARQVRSRILAGRQKAQAIDATLRNMTVMRRGVVAGKAPNLTNALSEVEKLSAAATTVTGLASVAREITAKGLGMAQPRGQEYLHQLRKQLEDAPRAKDWWSKVAATVQNIPDEHKDFARKWFEKLKDAHDDLHKGIGAIDNKRQNALSALKNFVDHSVDQRLNAEARRVLDGLMGIVARQEPAVEDLLRQIDGWVAAVDGMKHQAMQVFQQIREHITTIVADTGNTLDEKMEQYAAAVGAGLQDLHAAFVRLRQVNAAIYAKLQVEKTIHQMLAQAIGSLFQLDQVRLAFQTITDAAALRARLLRPLEMAGGQTAENFVTTKLEALIAAWAHTALQVRRDWSEAQRAAQEKIAEYLDEGIMLDFQALANAVNAWGDKYKAYMNHVQTTLDPQTGAIGKIIDTYFQQHIELIMANEVTPLRDLVHDQLGTLEAYLHDVPVNGAGDFPSEAVALYRDLLAAASDLGALGPLSQAKDIERFAKAGFESALRTYEGDLEKAKEAGSEIFKTIAALGDAPKALGREMGRDVVRYFTHGELGGQLQELASSLQFTATTALVNRVKDEFGQIEGIKALAAELPTREISEALEPLVDIIKTMKPGELLPNIAGLDLSGLFANLKLPEFNTENFNLTDGFDRATREAWAEGKIQFESPGTTEVFSLGPVRLTVKDPQFRASFSARAKVLTGGAQRFRRRIEGRIYADWQLAIGSLDIITFAATELSFENPGKLDFHIQPSLVRFNPSLSFLTQLAQASSPGKDSGFTIEMLTVGSVPAGVRAQLALPVPDIGVGVFSFTGMLVNASFFVKFLSGNFTLGVGAGFSSKERPFNVSILCLGGGGWFTTRAEYALSGGALTGFMSFGISAGAQLAINLGFASGVVFARVSLGAEVVFGSGAHGYAVFIRLEIGGEMSVLGLVTISMVMGLEGRYQQGSLVCTGFVSIHIKICWFIKISIDKSVTYVLAGKDSRALMLSSMDDVDNACDAHFDSFGED
jgi:hypothetical protein